MKSAAGRLAGKEYGRCSGSSALLHSTSLLQESQIPTKPAFGLDKHTTRAGLPKALLLFGNEFLVPNSGLSGARPCSRTAASIPQSAQGLVLHPNQWPSAGFSGQRTATRGCQRPQVTPPMSALLRWFVSARDAQPAEPSELMGPAARTAGGSADAGPAWQGGWPGSSAGRRRGRRRTRGAYCW